MRALLSVRFVDAFPMLVERVSGVFIVVMALVFVSPACAEKGKLRERLTPEVMAVVYPGGADRLGPEEGSPPAIAVYKGDNVVAFVFSTLDIIAAPGYSTTPFDVIGGVDTSGHITGAKVVFHNEPYIRYEVARQRLLDTFLAREAGRPLRGGTNLLPPDFVAGATVSARAMRSAVLATAGLVLRARAARIAATAPAGATGPVAATAPADAPAPAADIDGFKLMSWDELLAKKAVVRRRVTSGEVADALAKEGASDVKLDVPLGKSDDLYIEFVTGLYTVPAIGGNLLGMLAFEDYKNLRPSGTQAIFVAANGPYNFLGTKYTLESEGRRFDRLRVVQDGRTFGFVEGDYKWANPYAVGIRGQENAALFGLPADAGFDPAKPWRLEILVNGAGSTPVSVAFGLDYQVPDANVLTGPDDTPGERRAQPVVAAE